MHGLMRGAIELWIRMGYLESMSRKGTSAYEKTYMSPL